MIASTTARVHVRCVMSVTSAESDRVPSLLTAALQNMTRRALAFSDMTPRSAGANAAASLRSYESDDDGVEKNLAVGSRMSLTASVVFRRLAVAPPEGGFFRAAERNG